MSSTKGHISLRRRWQFWRARYTAPALLTRVDERKVVSAFTGINAGLSILTIGLFAWLTNLPLIFPALGPSAFILFSTPFSKTAAPRNVILGHFMCLGCGYLVWQFMSWATGSQVVVTSGNWQIFCSASVALALSSLLLIRFSCPHPPACASSLIVALGAFTHWHELVLMAVAVVWLTFQAVAINRFSGLLVPIWSPRRHETP